MKAHTISRWALAAGLALAAGACESLTEVNENPNAPTDVGAQFLLPQAIRSAVENTYGRMLLAHTSIWSQQTAQIQYPDEEQGNVRTETMQAFWNSYYAGAARDIQAVIDKGAAAGEPNFEAVGRIWKSWIFHQLTDLYGDAPYSEALQAEVGITTPVYDTQEDIYTDLLAELTAAAAMLDPTEPGFGNGDVLYGNDFAKWRRFANSLRMRLAMRLSEVDPTAAQAAFVAAFNDPGGVFQSNADNAMFEWPGFPYENLLYENRWLDARDDDGMSQTLIDTLISYSDPRLQLYAEPAATDGAYRGLQNNTITPPLSIANYSRIGNYWRGQTSGGTPTAIMTYSEVLFLQAEAAVRGWIAGVPATLYENAIRANMNQYDAFTPPPANAPTDAEIDAYVLQPQVVLSATPATALAQIALQKWISLFMQGSEAWANQRRTDLPALVPGPNLATSRIPVRFHYPPLEQSLNAANLMDAVTRQGGLSVVDLIWWDVS